MEKKMFKYWWTYTIKGIFALTFGLIALLISKASDEWLIQLFGGFLIVSGCFLLYGSVNHMIKHKKWGMWFFEGLLDIGLGIAIIVNHHILLDLDLFVIFVAIWAASVGFTQLFAAMSANKEIKTRWLLFINALIIIGAGFVLFYNPYDIPEQMSQTLDLIGVFTIIFGAFITLHSFGLKEQ